MPRKKIVFKFQIDSNIWMSSEAYQIMDDENNNNVINLGDNKLLLKGIDMTQKA